MKIRSQEKTQVLFFLSFVLIAQHCLESQSGLCTSETKLHMSSQAETSEEMTQFDAQWAKSLLAATAKKLT